MRIHRGLTLDRAGTLELNTWVGHVGSSRQDGARQDPRKPQLSRTQSAFGWHSKIGRRIERIGWLLLLAAAAASGQWRAAAFVLPPRMLLSWSSLGPGTQYYVQTSADLLTWTNTTNTTATNVGLTLTGNKSVFRVLASNAPPQSVMLAWDPAVPSAGVAGYSIYYGVSRGSYANRLSLGLVTTGVVSNLAAGTTYYFATTTRSASGLESGFSNEAVWKSQLRLKIQRLP